MCGPGEFTALGTFGSVQFVHLGRNLQGLNGAFWMAKSAASCCACLSARQNAPQLWPSSCKGSR